MKALIVHSIQFFVHLYFMYWTFTYYPTRDLWTFWNQIKYLTNWSNLNMFWFLVPFLITDIKNFRKEKYIYSYNAYFAYQIMQPVMFIVMFMYWLMYTIDPVLLFGSADPSNFSGTLDCYLHGINFGLMQLEQFLHPQPLIQLKHKSKWFLIYVFVYFGIYGVHYSLFGSHVYGFQEMMTPLQLVLMYLALFFTMFVLDVVFTELIYKPSQRRVIIKHNFLHHHYAHKQEKKLS